jgi:hypothetical protein
LDSLQVDLLDAGSNGSVFQLLVVVELSHHVWRRVPVPSLGDWWLARVCCRWAGLRGGRLGGRVGRHSWARSRWARSRWGRCLGRRRRGDPEARPASNAAPFAAACAAWETAGTLGRRGDRGGALFLRPPFGLGDAAALPQQCLLK